MGALHVWTNEDDDALGEKHLCFGHYASKELKCVGCEFDAECWRLKHMCGEAISTRYDYTEPGEELERMDQNQGV